MLDPHPEGHADPHPVGDAAPHPEARFRFGADEGQVRATARVVTRLPAGETVLDRLRGELERHGWAVGREPGSVPRVTGALDGLELLASYAAGSGAFALTVSSEPLAVGVVAARALVAGPDGR